MSTNINDLTRKAVEEVSGTKADEIKPKNKKETKSGLVKNTIVLKGKTYKVTPLDFLDGIDLWENILQKLLPSAGSGIDGMRGEALDADKTFTEVFTNLARNLDGETLKNYSLVLLSGCSVDGEPMDINKEFSGNYSTWLKLFVFALKENFGSFFEEGWGDEAANIVAMVGSLTAKGSQ